MAKKIPVAILGASGYTGAELVRLLYNHPHAEIISLAAETNAGKEMAEVYPHLRALDLPKITTLPEVKWNEIQAVFCCLPHAASQEIIAQLPRNLRIIDLSADFRIYDGATYEKWYGHPHKALGLQKEAVYGLSEIYRAAIKNARLVANPGCYPTSALLPLVPLMNSGKISLDGIIIDAKSGVTGAGRKALQENLFAEINEDVRAYSVGGHRHVAEIEQTLSAAALGTKVTVTFTPQVVPMNRGILSTIYLKMVPGIVAAELKEILELQYENELFVKIMPMGHAPSTREVKGANHCFINVFEDRSPGRAIIVSVIDNLVKGASGQAVQNFNIMFGFPEDTGLNQVAVFP